MIDVGRGGDPLAPAVWFLIAQAGHVGCHGWKFDRPSGVLRCVCGTALYEFHEVVRGGPSPSSAARHGRHPRDPG